MEWRARRVVVGVTVDKPWLPRDGRDAERTVQVTAIVRGNAISAVRLGVTIGSTTQQMTMTNKGGELYGVSYVVPTNTAFQREILLRPSAQNSAGTMYGNEEIVAQDGTPLGPPRIHLIDGSARVGKEIQFMVEWDGTWNNFDFDCSDYSEGARSYYNLRGQPITCTYPWPGVYHVAAVLYYQSSFKTTSSLEVNVMRYSVYMPIVRIADAE